MTSLIDCLKGQFKDSNLNICGKYNELKYYFAKNYNTIKTYYLK